MENIIVNITIGLMVLKISYNIISGYLSVNPSKKNILKTFLQLITMRIIIMNHQNKK